MSPIDPSSLKTQQATPRADESSSSDSTAGAEPGSRTSSEFPGRIGRYEIRSVLGAGAFGRVYRGFDPELHREVAIKVPHAAALTPELRERFLREARAAATIHHPNVCPIYDVGTADGVPYIVMRFVPGGTLAGLLAERKKPLPPIHAAAIVRKIALGVAAAHAKNVLHRDLKPANVLWDETMREVLVTDFGLARVGGTAQLSRTGEIMGTPAYMSPEQARGRQDEIGPLTDVYSVGVILYRILTGKVPFDGSVMEVLANAQFTEPESPSSIRHELDLRLDRICLKAMAKKPENRYASAKELAAALASYIRVAETSESAATTALVPLDLPDDEEPATPGMRNSKARIVALVAGIAAVCLGGMFLLSRLAKDKPAVTTPESGLKAGETRDVEIAPGIAMRFCWIPAGTAQLGAPASEPEAEPNELEGNRGKFATTGFWMGKYEVTQGEWKAVMAGTSLEMPSAFRLQAKAADRLNGITDTSDFPVENVSWDDCQRFLSNANRHGGIRKAFGASGTFELPQESQWEYACRGGLGNARVFYWGNQLDGSQANCDGGFPYPSTAKGIYLRRPALAGIYESKFPHPWGLCDMHGNVSEWCDNGSDGTNTKPVRGGSWFNYARNCRAASRNWFERTNRRDNLGLRVILSLD